MSTSSDRARAALEWAERGPHPNEPAIEPGLAPHGIVFQTWVG